MDLELNFAPPEVSGGKSRSNKVQGGRWKDRQKANQQVRRETKKVEQGSSRPVEKQQKSNEKTSKPSTFHGKTAPKSDQRPIAALAKQDAGGQASKEDIDRNGEIVTTTIQPAAPPAKRQVISSLFSSAPKLPRPVAQAKSADSAVLTPSNAPSLGDTFESLPLRPEVIAHLKEKMALKNPTTVQKLSLPFLCEPASGKKDALIQAQTGSGKTLAYLLPILHDLLQLSEHFTKLGKPLDRTVGTMAIILVPTRELANQISEVAMKLLSFGSIAGANHRWITPGMLTGGQTRNHEKARLRKGMPLLIATPGRLLDHLEATKAFRIAGETLRLPPDPAKKGFKRQAGAEPESDDEFAYEDAEYNALPGNDEDAGIDSDEDIEALAARAHSRSYRPHHQSRAPPRAPPEDPLLSLRWLVLDEADRLMDMGFEPQISKIVNLIEARIEKRKEQLTRASNRGAVVNRLSGKKDMHKQVADRRTVLCSATVEEKVKQLAGIALRDPMLIRGDDDKSKNGARASDGSTTRYAPPKQLSQNYAVVSPKLRFVALVALLRQVLLAPAAKGKRQKIVVFMSCTDAVDFIWQSVARLQMGRPSENEEADAAASSKSKKNKKAKAEDEDEKLDSRSALLPGIPIYRLHGSLDLQTRLGSLKGFASNENASAVLFCTSVAARGLDVQDVSCVIQYDLPTEGGVNEYIHRVGRTARAGGQGQAWALLLPSEVGWVRWAEDGMRSATASAEDAAGIQLQEKSVDDLLQAGFGGADQREYETRATDVQMAYERWVAEDEANSRLAKKAFSSHVRAYATHPSNEKHFFHVKNLHLGHMAKAFGLREAPAGIGGGAGKQSKAQQQQSQKNSADSKQANGKKRKASERDPDAASSDEEEREDKRIPRSGRALDGKGLHGPKSSNKSEFNLAGSSEVEAMLMKRRKK